MTEMAITARKARTEPKYKATAAALLERCRAFYQDPENERAYQEWKEKRNDTSQFIQRNRRTGSGGRDGRFYDSRAV